MSDLTRTTARWTELGEQLLPTPVTHIESGTLIVALYDAHQRDLYSFARSATDDPSVADDVVQEAFLRLVREINAGRVPDSPGGWLYRVCANLIVSQARRRRTSLRWRPFGTPILHARSAEDESLLRERRGDLARRLRRLPAESRVALLMAAQGVPGREIATALGRSESATRTILCRARRRLRSELERDGVGP